MNWAPTAEITFFDGTVVHVRPDSLITIEDTSEDFATKRRRVAWPGCQRRQNSRPQPLDLLVRDAEELLRRVHGTRVAEAPPCLQPEREIRRRQEVGAAPCAGQLIDAQRCNGRVGLV